jgi:hypothetical protein
MSAPQVSSAFIDLFASQTEPKAIATYGESYLYGRPSIKDYNDMYPRSIKQTLTIPVVILIIFFLIYIKG